MLGHYNRVFNKSKCEKYCAGLRYEILSYMATYAVTNSPSIPIITRHFVPYIFLSHWFPKRWPTLGHTFLIRKMFIHLLGKTFNDYLLKVQILVWHIMVASRTNNIYFCFRIVASHVMCHSLCDSLKSITDGKQDS